MSLIATQSEKSCKEMHTMSEERLKVLEMLASGTLTVEQASRLLNALGEQQLSATDLPNEPPEVQQPEQPATALNRDLLTSLLTLTGNNVAYVKELRDSGLIQDVPKDLLIGLTAVGGRDVS